MILGLVAVGLAMFVGGSARAELVVNEFAGTFGEIKVNAADLKKFSLDEGLITFSAADNVPGMKFDSIVFDLTGYAGPLGITNPIAVVDDTVTIRLESTMAKYDVVSAKLTQLLNSPIAVGFIELEMALQTSDLALGGESVLVPSTLSSMITINGLRITVVEQGGQKHGNAQVRNVASASITAIPEPTTFTLAGFGMLIVGLGLLGRRRG